MLELKSKSTQGTTITEIVKKLGNEQPINKNRKKK